MRKATTRRNEMRARVTTMVRDGMVYAHDPATVGHKKHTAECWTLITSLKRCCSHAPWEGCECPCHGGWVTAEPES